MTGEIFRKASWQAYEEGKAAYFAGQSDSVCPYVSRGAAQVNQSDQRLDWMSGYFQAKYGDKWEAR